MNSPCGKRAKSGKMTSFSTNKKDIRKFGIIAFIFFGILCGTGFWRHRIYIASFFGILSALGLGFILMPGYLRPIYSGWIKTANIIGTIVTAVVLSIAYYLVITPFALLRRVFSGSLIPLIPDKKCFTYWVERSEPAQPKERFIKRF